MDEQRLRVRAQLSEIAAVSDFIQVAAQRAGLDEQKIHHCQLAIDEVCTNIIEHGYGFENSDQHIEIVTQNQPERFIIQILDDSRPFNPLKRPDPDPNTALEERGTGGWGIFFVKKFMDDVQYDYFDGRNRLTLVKRHDQAPKEAETSPILVTALSNGVWLVMPKGRLDHTASKRLEAVLSGQLEAGHKQLILDMTKVDFVSSRALKMLVSLWKRARDMRGDLVLVGLSARVREVFSMIGFDLVFTIFTSVDEALTAHRQRSK